MSSEKTPNTNDQELRFMDGSSFTCEICCEAALSSHKFHHKNINCSHNFCMECITSYIQEKVEQNIATINCPELSCDKTLDPLECQPLIPRKLFIQWCGCLGNLHVSGFRKIHCPYPNCSELILNECDETVKKCSCPRCKRLFCYKCRVPWHAGYWCSESHRKRDRNEIQFGLLMEKMKWTRCPACGQPIERYSGCPNVICRCGKSFCHGCGRSSHYGPCRGSKLGSIWYSCVFPMMAIVLVLACGFGIAYLIRSKSLGKF